MAHKFGFFMVIIFTCKLFPGKGQNLVPNGNFEFYWGCPNGVAQIDSAAYWTNPIILSTGSTPDYFNQCNSPFIVGVPANGFGYQYAHTGDAYAGIMLWNFNPPVFREYVQVPILQLTANQCYYFEMYMSLSENYGGYTTDDVGVYFSDTLIDNFPIALLPFVPQINNATGNFPDTLNWTLVSGSFTANGTERYLIIGNYKNNANTDTVFVNPNSDLSTYVYIDDIFLSTCTGIEKPGATSGQFEIYPNPVKDELLVSGLKFPVGNKTVIKIYDVLGKEAQPETKNLKPETKINVSSLKNGVYLIEINDVCLPGRQGKNVLRKKFLKE
jgi:type IX secretion system substrate protein